ncbi:hypothetical protein EJ06DRAFT_30928 [Trichodelitschia bisporula]|uniref:Uncharacterized protein n=1 Tax=Trichodelitschia bisporula TaxID=703511 RepID=A0A6G1IBM8_9PEZI|nr:hypothetical protein EJ06DRAFT_30928 [Trichodelitschia bisporula]
MRHSSTAGEVGQAVDHIRALTNQHRRRKASGQTSASASPTSTLLQWSVRHNPNGPSWQVPVPPASVRYRTHQPSHRIQHLSQSLHPHPTLPIHRTPHSAGPAIKRSSASASTTHHSIPSPPAAYSVPETPTSPHGIPKEASTTHVPQQKQPGTSTQGTVAHKHRHTNTDNDPIRLRINSSSPPLKPRTTLLTPRLIARGLWVRFARLSCLIRLCGRAVSKAGGECAMDDRGDLRKRHANGVRAGDQCAPPFRHSVASVLFDGAGKRSETSHDRSSVRRC